MYEFFEQTFDLLVRYGILLLEMASSLVILVFFVKSVWFLIRRDHERSHSSMAEGITTALTLLLGSEVLRTIIAPDWKGIGMTCAILLMRAGVTLLLRWESYTAKPKPKD